MRIRIGYDIVYDLPAPTALLLMLYTHPSRGDDLLEPDLLHTEPSLPIQEFTDGFGNRCARLLAPAGRLRLFSDALVHDSGQPSAVSPQARQHDVQDLPPEVLPFLLGSRYCEVEIFSQIAWDLFGQSPPGWGRVQSVCDWVHANVQFDYMSARVTKTAHDVWKERTGVCRDFQHLAITFCRCLNIPARYATGYLGDIGVPPKPPMDFSAWFEVYLEGGWHLFDARNNVPRIGYILMATGRDATDVALTTSFGPHRLEQFLVVADEVPEPAP